ncbi:MAG TPA: GntR family transcriptional regulator [Acidimicrobiales bacterium]|nr:GntR family transcriptional regulator [Acidimicrobiales bacterium]
MAKSVYAQLRNDIVTGKRPPGTPLVESALARHFGVSRTPVREALLQLRQDGLVERSGRAHVVRQRSPEEILEIYEMRILLEGAAARGAARRRTDLDLSRLRRAHADMAALSEQQADDRVAANRAFHKLIWAASHNRTLVDLLERIEMQLLRYPETTLGYPGRWPAVLAEHEALIEAIARQREEEAGELAARHMAAARDIRLEMYASAD